MFNFGECEFQRPDCTATASGAVQNPLYSLSLAASKTIVVG
jgi:hypothetical protein